MDSMSKEIENDFSNRPDKLLVKSISRLQYKQSITMTIKHKNEERFQFIK